MKRIKLSMNVRKYLLHLTYFICTDCAPNPGTALRALRRYAMVAMRPDATSKELDNAKKNFTFKYRRAARNVCQFLPQSATTSRRIGTPCFLDRKGKPRCADITRSIAMSTTMIHPKLSAESGTRRICIQTLAKTHITPTRRSICTAAVRSSTFSLTSGSGSHQRRVHRVPNSINSCGTWGKSQLRQLSARSGFRNSRPSQI